MYTAFYGLREKPFALVPDPRYLYLSDSHREALAHLLYGIDEGEGFIAVTGEVGTGKTTICRTLLERLGSETEVAFLFNPSLSGIELLQDISSEFGLETMGKNRSELGTQLNRFLLEKREDRRRVLLIIDEAQNLSEDTLEQVRLLSNLETSSSKLIQILLLGQPELDVKLDSPELRQLRQRISVRWGLGPLSARETRDYVRHRLHVAAGADRSIFTDAALREVHRRTGGVPRLVNVLCDRSLLAGYVAKSGTIGPKVVREAAAEIPDARRRRPASPRGGSLGAMGAGRFGIVLGLGVLLGAAAVAALVVFPLTENPRADLPPDVAFHEAPSQAREGLTDGMVDAIEPIGVASPPPEASPAMARDDFALANDLGSAESVAVVPATVSATTPDLVDSLDAGTVPDVVADAGVELAAGVEPLQVAAIPVAALPLQDGNFLTLAMADQTAATARRAGVDGVLRSFGLTPEGGRLENDASALLELERRGLSVLQVADTSLGMLGALNHPTLLLVEAPGVEPRLLGLKQLEEDRVWLYGLLEDAPLRIPRSELEAHWTADAWVVWKEFEDAQPVLSLGHNGPEVAWLQSSLKQLGYYDGEVLGLFDRATQDGVLSLQRRRSIPVDGIAGPRTRMVLYDLLEGYDVPRITPPAPSEEGG